LNGRCCALNLLRSAGATRILPAVAETEAFLATAAFAETKQLPKDSNHPLFKLFPEFVEQLKSLAG